jgi:hypothetical protein
MRRGKVWGMMALRLAMGMVVLAQGFKVYPGAKKYTPPETEEAKEAAKMAPGTVSTIYLTDDSFEKVASFYRSVGKEFAMPGMQNSGKLPNGQAISMVFFILDGAASLKESKSWMKVQRPYIGSVDFKSGTPEYKDVRDVTLIQSVEKK